MFITIRLACEYVCGSSGGVLWTLGEERLTLNVGGTVSWARPS